MSDETTAAIAVHAEALYPSECCGVVIAGPRGARAVRIDNVYDQLHARYPDAYPRTSRTAYEMDALQLDRAFGALGPGERLDAIYHSHCDVGAYFSEEDARAALGGGDAPMLACDYLVASVRGGAFELAKRFRWDGAKFAEVA